MYVILDYLRREQGAKVYGRTLHTKRVMLCYSEIEHSCLRAKGSDNRIGGASYAIQITARSSLTEIAWRWAKRISRRGKRQDQCVHLKIRGQIRIA